MKIQLKRSPLSVAACGAAAVACVAIAAPAAHAQSGFITNIVYTSQDDASQSASTKLACDDQTPPIVSTTNCHIKVVNTSGVGTAITSGNVNDVDPAPSPDGKRIAFARAVGGPAGQYDIYVMDSNGANVAKLTSSARDDRYPAWSPDGSRIAYRGYPAATGGAVIITMNPDGSAPRPVFNTGGGDQPTWSPDGTRIAYSAVPSLGLPEDIFVQPVGALVNDEPVNVTNDPNVSDRYPSWQPVAGSSRILFRRAQANGRELWAVDAGTLAVGGPLAVPATGGIGRAASWARDGSLVAFVSYFDPNGETDQEIWLGNVAGNTIGNTRQLTANQITDDEPKVSSVPAPLSAVPPPTTVAGGAGSAGGIVSSSPLTVGGGTTASGHKALSLTLTVPKQNLGKKKKTVRATVKCSAKCIVTMTGSTKLKVGSKTKTLKLQRINKTIKANVATRINVRLPLATLRSVRSALRRKKRVTITIQATARTSSGEFTPAAKRKLVLRR